MLVAGRGEQSFFLVSQEDLVLLRLSLLMRIELLELPKESKPETNPHQSLAAKEFS